MTSYGGLGPPQTAHVTTPSETASLAIVFARQLENPSVRYLCRAEVAAQRIASQLPMDYHRHAGETSDMRRHDLDRDNS